MLYSTTLQSLGCRNHQIGGHSMGTTEIEVHDAESRIEEDWVEPLRRALETHGRPAYKHKWHIAWHCPLAGGPGGGLLEHTHREHIRSRLGQTKPGKGRMKNPDGRCAIYIFTVDSVPGRLGGGIDGL
jgi:hypothetical protein